MIVLGIDPGTRRVGYGVVEHTPRGIKLIGAGLLKITSSENLDALGEIRTGVAELIGKFHPELLAIEKLFFMKNQKTGIQVAEARGVIIAAATHQGLVMREFSPNEIKLGITGYGLADKKSVQKMVRLILGEPELDLIDDASDALAVAILGCGRSFPA